MLRTPPTQTEAKFSASPCYAQGQPSSEAHEQGSSSKITHPQALKSLPTPKTPRFNSIFNSQSPSSLSTPAKRNLAQLETSFDTSVFSTRDELTSSPSVYDSDITSPLNSSPIDLSYRQKPTALESPVSAQLTSPVTKKYLPSSQIVAEGEILQELDDSIVDDSMMPTFRLTKPLGKGAYSTVLECTIADQRFAVKVPTNIKKSKFVFREMLNYKIVQNYLNLHNFDTKSFPILNAHGLIFLDKSHYNKLRFNETVPCMLAPCISSDLEKLITISIPQSPMSLHIGANLWWKLSKQLAMALIVLKDCHMVHMDFKTANILYDDANEEFKVADFTSAALQEDILLEHQQKLDNGVFFDLTLQYCAPELLTSPPSAPSYDTDLFAIGLILLSAATGEDPYSEIIQTQTTSTMIHLNECIKKNKVLDVLSPNALRILEANRDVYDLIRLIIIERAPLQTVVDYLNKV